MAKWHRNHRVPLVDRKLAQAADYRNRSRKSYIAVLAAIVVLIFLEIARIKGLL